MEAPRSDNEGEKPNFAAEYQKTYSSPKCYITVNGKVIQQINITISRERAPIYTMGTEQPRGLSEGKRCIAGTLMPAEEMPYPSHFNVDILGHNEYGNMMLMQLLGCETIPTVDVEGIVFTAKKIEAWHAVQLSPIPVKAKEWPPWGVGCQ